MFREAIWILIWKAENASGEKGILLNSEEVRYMQFESNSEFVVKKLGLGSRLESISR